LAAEAGDSVPAREEAITVKNENVVKQHASEDGR